MMTTTTSNHRLTYQMIIRLRQFENPVHPGARGRSLSVFFPAVSRRIPVVHSRMNAPAPDMTPELLAPAGNWDCARAAVAAGADAIYFGLPRFNARLRAWAPKC